MAATDAALVATVESYFGTPYNDQNRFAPGVGLDCSGTAVTALKAVGDPPPGDVTVSSAFLTWAQSAGTATTVDRASLIPGAALIRNGLGAAGDIAIVIAPGQMAVTPCPAGHFLGPAPTTWGHYDEGIMFPGLSYTGVVAGGVAAGGGGGGGCDPTDPTTWLQCVAEVPADILKAAFGGHSFQEIGLRVAEVLGGALLLAVGAIMLMRTASHGGEAGRIAASARHTGRRGKRAVRRVQHQGQARTRERQRQGRRDDAEQRHLENVTRGQGRRRGEEGPGYTSLDDLAGDPF